jgi:hypothetical protein
MLESVSESVYRATEICRGGLLFTPRVDRLGEIGENIFTVSSLC